MLEPWPGVRTLWETPLSGIDGAQPIRAVESQPKGVSGKTGRASLRPARETDNDRGDESTL